MAHSDPVALSEALRVGAQGHDFETAFVAAYCGGFWGSQKGREGRLGWVHALDLVYVGWVYGAGEGAEEDGGGWEGGREGVVVQAGGLLVGFFLPLSFKVSYIVSFEVVDEE